MDSKLRWIDRHSIDTGIEPFVCTAKFVTKKRFYTPLKCLV